MQSFSLLDMDTLFLSITTLMNFNSGRDLNFSTLSVSFN